MKLLEAQRLAQRTANETNSTVLVYQSLLHTDIEDYDAAFTLPEFGQRIGEPYVPIKSSKKDSDEPIEVRKAVGARD